MNTKLCRPILLLSNPNDETSKGVFNTKDRNWYNIFLISLDSKKYSGDRCICLGEVAANLLPENKNNQVSNFTTWSDKSTCQSCKKIIATQEQLAPEYIQQFIEEYNTNSVKDVEIEIEEELWEAATFDNKYIHSTKEACLHFIEFQVYGLKNSLKQLQPSTPRLINGFVNIINNSKSQILYTENEVSNLIFKLKEQIISEYKAQLTNIDILEWFQHNKKK